MIRLIHKRVYNKHFYYAEDYNAKKLFSLFRTDHIIGKEAIDELSKLIAIEIIEFPSGEKNNPYKFRRKVCAKSE